MSNPIEIDVSEATNYYYSLKNKYESQIQRQKEKIMDKPLSRKEKREEFLKIEKKCVLCKREGGTIFSNNNRILKAVCGANPPCPLNIEIKLGRYVSVDELLNTFDEVIEEEKWGVIKMKLDLLFNFISEEEAISGFEKKRELFVDSSKIREEILINKMMVTENPETIMKIESLKSDLYQNILEIKRLISNYKTEDKSEYLNEAIETYRDKIIPLEENIRKLKYTHNTIDIDLKERNPVYNIIEKHYTLLDIELAIDADDVTKVIKYEINLKKKKVVKEKGEKEIKPIRKPKITVVEESKTAIEEPEKIVIKKTKAPKPRRTIVIEEEIPKEKAEELFIIPEEPEIPAISEVAIADATSQPSQIPPVP